MPIQMPIDNSKKTADCFKFQGLTNGKHLNDRVLHFAVDAGQMMLESGAETYRVEETINNMLMIEGTTCSAYVTLTGITASIEDPVYGTVTLIRRIKARANNLYNIHFVNQLSRDLVRGNITFVEAEKVLQQQKQSPNSTSKWSKFWAAVFMTSGFALLLSGSLINMLASFIPGIITGYIMYVTKLPRLNSLIANFVTAFMVGIAARLMTVYIIPTADHDIIIASSLMALFPGVAITNAIRDTFNGDYVSANARILEAFMSASYLALGTGLGLWLSRGF